MDISNSIMVITSAGSVLEAHWLKDWCYSVPESFSLITSISH